MFAFTLLAPRTPLGGGVPPDKHIPREKHVALGETGVRTVPFLHYYDRVLHMAVGEIYPEVGAVNFPPLTLLHGAVNCSCRQRERDQVRLCLCCVGGVEGGEGEGGSRLSPLNPCIF